MSTRSRRYTGAPVDDVPTSTSPISRVLWNSPGGVDADVLGLGLEDAAGSGDVAGAQDLRELRDRQVEGGEPLLRVVEVDLLGQNARALHLRDQRARAAASAGSGR